MIQAQIIYALWCVFWAYANYRGIVFANVWILHGINGLLHGSIWYGMVLISKNLEILTVAPFIGKMFFDVALSKFRALPLIYIPVKPKSILDQLEKKLFFNNGIYAKVTYLVIIIALNLYYYYGGF
jgi:hypothetical protein